MANILIIDDDPTVSKLLCLLVHRIGHQAVWKATLQTGVAEAMTNTYDIVFLDVHLPDGNGLDALPNIRQTASNPVVIVLTAYGQTEGARVAVQYGAWDYIQKSDDISQIRFQIRRAIEYRQGRDVQPSPDCELYREGIIGDSAKMTACYDLLAQAADNDVNVHLTGETGVGKDIFARAIHRNSKRKNQPFVTIDCSVLHQNLKESDLFGYVKGAFTGADKNKQGLIALADGGVLFLDEVGDLSLADQRLFLRLLQEQRFRPLGGKKDRQSNFRLITATNKDIDRMAKKGCFRIDLFFRLRGMMIDLPPLRERDDDIKILAVHYIRKLCRRQGMEVKKISSDFIQALYNYKWPGNVRELIKALETALAAASDSPTLYPFHLPMHIRTCLVESELDQCRTKSPHRFNQKKSYENLPLLADLLETTEREYLQHLSNETGGDVDQIVHVSGLSRATLYRRLKKYQIKF